MARAAAQAATAQAQLDGRNRELEQADSRAAALAQQATANQRVVRRDAALIWQDQGASDLPAPARRGWATDGRRPGLGHRAHQRTATGGARAGRRVRTCCRRGAPVGRGCPQPTGSSGSRGTAGTGSGHGGAHAGCRRLESPQCAAGPGTRRPRPAARSGPQGRTGPTGCLGRSPSTCRRRSRRPGSGRGSSACRRGGSSPRGSGSCRRGGCGPRGSGPGRHCQGGRSGRRAVHGVREGGGARDMDTQWRHVAGAGPGHCSVDARCVWIRRRSVGLPGLPVDRGEQLELGRPQSVVRGLRGPRRSPGGWATSKAATGPLAQPSPSGRATHHTGTDRLPSDGPTVRDESADTPGSVLPHRYR
jgi:hypothetical protein